MGKNLKGRECGKGICQRTDGKYAARFTSKSGRRHEKHFDTLPEARNRLADAQYEDKHGITIANADMTVDMWFKYWMENLICDLAPNTKRNYQERYKTIRQAYIAMGTMFKSAVMNGLISKHPMDGVRFNKPVRAVDDINFLTVEEQERFLEVAKRSHNYHQYALILETGLRTGEMIGLTWDAIDWENGVNTITSIQKTIGNKGDIRRYEIRYCGTSQCGQIHPL